MGGDSRCNTAPLPVNGPHSLDDLLLPGGVSSSGTSLAGTSQVYSSTNEIDESKRSVQDGHEHQSIGEKDEILMSKLMMESDEITPLRDLRDADLAMTLGDADWKQQLDKGKSEHLANFLNEPMMTKHQQQQPVQQELGRTGDHTAANKQTVGVSVGQGDADKMLSGGLNSSDEEGNRTSCETSLEHNNHHRHHHDNHGVDEQQEYVNYLDSDSVDIDAGLPPDDNILDLFER